MTDFGLSPFLSDGMVIQRDEAFPVWSREKITVSFLGKTYEARQADGKWLVTLEPVKAGGPHTMEIKGGNGSVKINDIYSGDLWMCAGQSNMEMQMQRLRDDFSEEWQIKDYPLIRQFTVPQEWDFSSPRDELTGGNWLSASAQTLHEFSGTAWFFAKKLYEKNLSQGLRVPIGLVNTAWGGTPVEAWMSEDALKDFPAKIAEGKQYADPAKRAVITEKTAAAISEWETNLANGDLGLAGNWKSGETDICEWDEMILPGDFAKAGLEKFCGVIWLAKDFNVSESFAKNNARIWLGTIVDADCVFVNGVEVGNTTYRYPPRKYVPQGLIKKGKNRIVIRVTCNNGEGAVTSGKPFRIFTDNETVEFSGVWKYKIGVKTLWRPDEFFFQRQPTGNYNAMIAPVLKYPLKGVIWYQGESNDPNPREYEQLFRLMVQDWRKKNGKELPFLFVQLPIYGVPSDNNESSSWAIIREAQKAALSLPATGMAAALELGEWNDIHPLDKKGVGERLYLAAEKLLFADDNSSPGPMLRTFERRQGKLVLFFDNCSGGLTTAALAGRGLTANAPADGSEKPYVSVIEGDVGSTPGSTPGGTMTRLVAEIEGKNVISIDISSVKNPKKVLYAWAGNPRDRQLYNSDGLVALPFKIDL
jgi:sialate O-acetylesterase